jgi:hypothetical protein
MLKLILRGLFAFLVVLLGFCFFYIAYRNISEKEESILFIICGVIFLAIGLFLFFKLSKLIAFFVKPNNCNDLDDKEGLEETLEKNNVISSRWSKIIEKRDKLKMLEIAAAAEEENKLS